MNPWWFLAVPAAIVMTGIVGRTIWRFLHGVNALADAVPTLLTIANIDFAPKKDGSGSLREVVDGIDARLTEHVENEEISGARLQETLGEHTQAIGRIEDAALHAVTVAQETAQELSEHREVMQAHIEEDRAAFGRIERHQAAQVQAEVVAHEAAAAILHEKAPEVVDG